MIQRHLVVGIIFPNAIWSKWIPEAIPELFIDHLGAFKLFKATTGKKTPLQEISSRRNGGLYGGFLNQVFHGFVFSNKPSHGLKIRSCRATQRLLASKALRRPVVRPLVFDLPTSNSVRFVNKTQVMTQPPGPLLIQKSLEVTYLTFGKGVTYCFHHPQKRGGHGSRIAGENYHQISAPTLNGTCWGVLFGVPGVRLAFVDWYWKMPRSTREIKLFVKTH